MARGKLELAPCHALFIHADIWREAGGGDKREGKFSSRRKKMAWYRKDKAAVAEALRRGERPDWATTMASGPLEELVALHEELGIFGILDAVEARRARAGVPDELVLRTLATLPFVEQASLSGASEVVLREPAVLLQLGWAPPSSDAPP